MQGPVQSRNRHRLRLDMVCRVPSTGSPLCSSYGDMGVAVLRVGSTFQFCLSRRASWTRPSWLFVATIWSRQGSLERGLGDAEDDRGITVKCREPDTVRSDAVTVDFGAGRALAHLFFSAAALSFHFVRISGAARIKSSSVIWSSMLSITLSTTL